MNFRLLFFLLITFSGYAQTINDCQQRFQSYLNFKNQLNSRVKFEKDVLYITGLNGKREFSVYEEELNSFAKYFENSSLNEQQQLIRKKGNTKFSKNQCDSLIKTLTLSHASIEPNENLPLLGLKIALDPGHFSTNLIDAQAEQKYLYFPFVNEYGQIDTVTLFESQLTYNTVHILKKRLEEQGAVVFTTRQQANFTSFNCTFGDWIKYRRKHTLDSLKQLGVLTAQKHKHLLSCSNYDLFWDFFRDYDLANRAAIINAFKPDLTLIVHYNVDEKNAPWKKTTNKNYTMTFIGGGYTNDNLNKPEGKTNFIRQLLTDQLNRSEVLSAKTVYYFNQILNIPIATAKDADYLMKNCLSTASPGVFCRNLALCRKINSPLVYGESLYQDHHQESLSLMKTDSDIYGIKTNERIFQVAGAYFEAVMAYCLKKE